MTRELSEHPYADFLDRVQKPSRYVGGEHGEVRKDWDAVQARMCLAFPDVYDIGMSHLGFKILYGILNGHDKLLAERAYTPWTDMEEALRARGEPLRSLESWRPLSDFDCVGFSLQFELTFTNVLTTLDLGGIPLRTADRGEDAPLILAGGPTATHCEPLAPFLDAVVIGDGEEKTPEILLTWSALKRAGMPRRERLIALAKLGGVYVPSLYETALEPQTGMRVVSGPSVEGLPFPVERAMVEDLNDHPFPHGGPVASTETIFDRVSVEIARGCTEGCRFCQAGMIYRPVRERSPESILESIQKAVKDGGYDEASLTCLSTADYSAIHPLVKEVMRALEKDRVSLSVSSLRAYGLDEELLDEIKKVRATGLTFAPEAGTQRMRDVVNKNVTEEQLMLTAERVFERGWSRMKLYFMIGLPTEEEEDVRGIVQTGARARDVGRRLQKGKGPQVTVSVSIHVPKPHTPFQWCAMDPRDLVRDKQAWLREEAKATKVKLRMHDSEGSWLEGVVARGDRTLADVIEHAWRKGARFDSWDEQLKMDAWADAFEACEVDPSIFLGTIPVSARLPWDHVDVGLEEGFLAREYRKALKNRLSPPCGKAAGMFVHHTNLEEARADARRLVCYDCGVACDMTSMREERLTFLRQLGAESPPPPRAPRDRTEKVEPKHRKPPNRIAQGEPMRVRLRYAKLGRAAYRGHLDLVRVLPRIFRRLGMPLFYSRGFHPKPEMTFGPALSLGISSLSEYVDVKLDSEVPFDRSDLPARLNEVSELGLEFLDAEVLGNGDKRITRCIDEGVYVAGVPHAALADRGLGDLDALRARVDERRDGPLVVHREIKGIGKKVDVGKYLLHVEPGAGADVLARAGIGGRLVPIRLRLRITGGGTAKPTEALEALLGEPDLPVRLVREALLSHVDADGRPVRVAPHDLSGLRAPRRARAEAAVPA
ncbi:MAG TPA: TIGR03960 family B12-binding radical SAM protein [Sandaracinaceae bacterium LLY-WYZ-13_1]|nr:TIGR03960 family B12-binding radical SAM protein [Sandaracinaceae bacterium LLY-WYZ-13_1]